MAEKSARTLAASFSVVREPRAKAVAPSPIAAGRFVITRRKRAAESASMLAIRTPAASETTSLPTSRSPISRNTGSTTEGFTPTKMTSARRATSALSATTVTPVSRAKDSLNAASGWLAMIASGAQNFAPSSPRITAPARLPAPMTPSSGDAGEVCKSIRNRDHTRW